MATAKPGDSPATTAAAGPAITSVEDALRVIARISHPREPFGLAAILLWAAQAHVVWRLDSVFYLAFKGKTGAGKGTSLESACLLCPTGVVLSLTTEAYLATVLDEGRAVGIPEVDRLLDRDPIIAKMLRDGYRRGAVAGLKVPGTGGHGWENAERSLFGPKAFDFHLTIDPHLLGRTIVVEMDPDPSVERAMDAEKKARHLAPVREWLESESAKVEQGWSQARVDSLWDDHGFREEVERLGGLGGREHVLGANLLLVCRMFGWRELESEIPRMLAGRSTIDDWSEEAEVLEAIREEAGETVTPETFLPTNSLLERLNSTRSHLGLRAITFRALGRNLVDLGFRKGIDWSRESRGPLRGRWVLRPYQVLTQLTQMGHSPAAPAPPPVEEKPNGGHVSVAPDGSGPGPTAPRLLPPGSLPCPDGRGLTLIGRATFLHTDDRTPCYHPDGVFGTRLGLDSKIGTNRPGIDTASSPEPRKDS